jgi:hypothetical protein
MVSDAASSRVSKSKNRQEVIPMRFRISVSLMLGLCAGLRLVWGASPASAAHEVPGVYFARVAAGGFYATRKMVLLK